MSFRVEPDDIDGYAALLGRARDDAEAAKRYLSEHGEMSVGEQGWLAQLGDSHKSISGAVERELEQLRKITGAASHVLGNAAGYYRKSDQKAVTEADDAYKPLFTRADYTRNKATDNRSGGI